MADVVGSILGPAVESALKNVGAIIKRQLIYLFCFTRNIRGLEEEAENLNDQVHGVNAKIVEVTNNAREINPQVTTWLKRSDEFIEEKSAILKEVPNVTGGCLRLATRFSLSRKAKKTTEAIAQHRQDSNFENMSLPPPAPATKESLLGKTFSFDSRKKIEQDIMNTLRDKKGTIIAIHGMGGLGKTIMAKRIMNALLNERVFDEVVIAVVSQQIDELKIQCDIGDSLGLTDLKAKTSSQARAQILHARLSAGTTRTLLVLDDVWEKIQLEDFGIPCAYEGCTILITSRNSDALRAMDVKNIFEMEQLSEKDAWFMFRESVGTCVDDEELISTAKEVMRECRGLPIALEALGAALKDEKSKGVWKDTLKKLRKPNPRNTPYYIAEVYNPLIVSYDKLDEEFKTPFLLCCLFREDANIPVEFLTYFCMGLRLFEDLESLEEVRDRMCSVVKMLKSRSLLLDIGEGEGLVRLHDVVRDVCIFIAKQKRYIGGNDCTWISNSQLPNARTINLRLLYSDDNQFKIDDTYFEGMRELCVLSFISNSSTSLPLTIQSLNHLRTLILYFCKDLETIYVIGSLVHLEILICHECGSIKELPEEMKGLKKLKLLELTQCRNLESVGRGIISSLVELEELKMLKSFDRWDAAHLREVGELNKLRCLEIEIADEALVAEDINLSSKPEQFQIRFGDSRINLPKRFNKKMKLRLNEGIRHWIRKLLKDTECLDVQGNGAANIQNYFSNIHWLKLRDCEGIKSIATTSGVLLEHLELWKLPQLEEIWNGPVNSLTCLQNLKEIILWNLPALKHLWKSNTNIVSLPQLEILEISNCEMMEQLFVWSEEDENEITNRGSPNAMQIQGVKFPLLRKMTIIKCPKMRSITGTSKTDIDDHSSHFFCHPEKVSFGCLEELKIDWNPFCRHHHIYVSFNEIKIMSICGYNGSLSLFTATVVRNLVNLKKLEFIHCHEMVAVIEDDNEEGFIVSDGECNRLLHNLQILRLYNLRKLVRFCNSKSDAELPSVKRLDISQCRNMTTNLSLAPLALDYLGNLKEIILWHLPALKHLWKSNTNIVSLPQLETLEIYSCEMMEQLFVWSEEDENEITNRGSPNRDVIKIHFPQLRKMKIVNCPKMRSIISTTSLNGDGSNNKTGIDDHSSHLVSLPQLEILEISNCEMMENLFVWSEEGENEITKCYANATQIQGVKFSLLRKMKITECPKLRGITGTSKTDIDDHSSHFFCQPEKVSFGRLKEIEIDWNPFCHHHHISASFFNEIEKMSISGYHGSLSLFTATVARNLVNLKELVFSYCDEMVAVIEDDNEEGITVSDGECNRPFPNLKILRLKNLQKLVRFYNSKSDAELPSVKRLDISQCRNMTTNLSLAPLALDYLGNLKEIELWSLPALKHLWKSNTNIVSLPQLEILEIDDCEMMEQLFVWSEEGENEITHKRSPNATQIQGVKFPNLRRMKITKCPKMRSITGTSKTDIDDHSSHLFCQPEKVSFGRLKELETQWNPFCHHIHIYASFFNGIEYLSIHEYHGNLSLFTATITRNLINLKELRISDCDEMVAVIEDDKEEGITLSDGECIRPFPNLQILQLESLRKLVSFCNSKSNVELPSLKRLDISRCPNTTTNLSLAPLALEEVRTDLDCYLGVLFKETGNYPSCSLHETRIFSFVNGLQKLHIDKYKGSMSIFSSSIAENLINLRELRINSCDEIVKVIEGGERSGTILFPKLQKLYLDYLPKLEIFSEWESTVELPLLKTLQMNTCPNMMKFTLGSVATPCLNFVHRDYHEYVVHGTTDLNGALQQYFFEEEEITNEDDGDDENRDSEGDTSNGDGDVEIDNGTNEASEREDEQSTSYDEKMDEIN